jgi:hypothetical protein
MWYITYFKNTNKEKKKRKKKARTCYTASFVFKAPNEGKTFKGKSQSHFRMAPAEAFRWCAAVLALMLCLLVSPSTAIYCDEDDCYDLLGSAPAPAHQNFLSVSESTPSLSQFYFHWSIFTCIYRVSQNANGSEIKKAYYKLSLK